MKLTTMDKTVWGPLAELIGVWEGDKGDDIAPSDDRGIENNRYRERVQFEPMKAVQNHEQTLQVLRYETKIWRIGESETFHEELGYWTWESATRQIMRCFLVPRGIALIAGGTAEPTAKEFTLRADVGSTTFGICSNPFLDREFRTMSYSVTVRLHAQDRWEYEQDSVLQMPGQKALFHHRDRNVLRRVVTS